MDCEEVRNMMVLCLWGEADREQQSCVRRHLKKCGECRLYFAHLRRAKATLYALKKGRLPSRPRLLPRIFLRLAAPLAAGIILLVMPTAQPRYSALPPWPSTTLIKPLIMRPSSSPTPKKRRMTFSERVKRLRSRIESTQKLFAKLW